MNASKAIFIATLSFTAVVLAIIFPAQRGAIAVVWALWVFAYVLNQLRAAARRLVQPESSTFERVIAPVRPARERPQDLIRCEHAIGWKVYEPREFDHHVRPLLRELVHDRVRRRYGIGLDDAPDAVRERLDPELLALTGDQSAADIYGHNLRTHDIAAIVEKIERLP